MGYGIYYGIGSYTDVSLTSGFPKRKFPKEKFPIRKFLKRKFPKRKYLKIELELVV